MLTRSTSLTATSRISLETIFINSYDYLFQDNITTEEDSPNNNDYDSDDEQSVPRILYDNSAESDQGGLIKQSILLK